MQLIRKLNKGTNVLSNVIDILSKHTWVIPLKSKRSNIITNAFQKILKESNCKPNNMGR